MFHPSAAGYALAAKQLLPALCNALGEFIGHATADAALESRAADGNSLLARVGGAEPAVASHDRGARAHRGARELGSLGIAHSI